MYSRLLTNIPQNFKTYENLLKQFQLPMQKKWGFFANNLDNLKIIFKIY